MLAVMWLEELKLENKLSNRLRPEYDGGQDTPQKADLLTKDELARLSQRAQALHDELATTVRHIDPAEYSEERVHALLTEAHLGGDNRRRSRKTR